MSKSERLWGIAEQQQGLFTASQAKEASYSDSNFQKFVETNTWTKEGRGIYRLARFPFSERPELVCWSLWSRNQKGDIFGIWSHETALEIYDLSDVCNGPQN